MSEVPERSISGEGTSLEHDVLTDFAVELDVHGRYLCVLSPSQGGHATSTTAPCMYRQGLCIVCEAWAIRVDCVRARTRVSVSRQSVSWVAQSCRRMYVRVRDGTCVLSSDRHAR